MNVRRKSVKNQYVYFFSILLAILCSLIYCHGVLNGDDTIFHLNRIKSLSEAISQGNLFPKIYWNQNFGYGYGSPLFYSDFFLMIPAILNLFGLNVVTSYQILIIFISFLSGITVGYLIKRHTESKYVLFICMMMYVLAPYRLTDVFLRGALGEVLVFIFLPIVMMGIEDLFLYKSDKISNLVIGFSGIALSHNISLIIVSLFFFVFMIQNFREIIKNKKVIKLIIYAVIITIGICAFFLLPMLEQMMNSTFRYSQSTLAQGIDYLQVFSDFPNGLFYILRMSPGILSIIIAVVVLMSKDTGKFERKIISTGLLFLALTSSLIPLGFLRFMTIIQFPFRLLMIPTLCFVYSNFLFLNKIHFLHGITKKSFLVFIFFISLLPTIIQTRQWGIYFKYNTPDSVLNIDRISTRFEDSFPRSASELAMGEYLSILEFDYRQTMRKVQSTTIDLATDIHFNESYNSFTFTIPASTEETTWIIPKTYYKGYYVKITDKNGLTRIEPCFPEEEYKFIMFSTKNGDTKCDIYYKGTKIQNISSWLSLITLGMCLIFYLKKDIDKGRKNNNVEKNKRKIFK
ncbi:MAG: hypothetical protein RR945_01645 [Erysipelotrichaceae bacterium]